MIELVHWNTLRMGVSFREERTKSDMSFVTDLFSLTLVSLTTIALARRKGLDIHVRSPSLCLFGDPDHQKRKLG